MQKIINRETLVIVTHTSSLENNKIDKIKDSNVNHAKQYGLCCCFFVFEFLKSYYIKSVLNEIKI